MPKSIELKVYRSYHFDCQETGQFTLSAMARPIDRNLGVSEKHETLDYLFTEKAHTGLLSITDREESHLDGPFVASVANHLKKSSFNYGYVSHDFVDFTSPSVKSFDEFRQKIFSLVRYNGNKPAMHCGAGCGRSGTMIASLYVYQLGRVLILLATKQTNMLNKPSI